LVRHGETEWNRTYRIQGAESDIPLNELGLEQAKNLALRLKTEKIQAIYSSPLQRALHTARAIAGYHQMEVTSLPALKEIRVGQLEGAYSSTLKIRWDQLLCQGLDGQEGLSYGIEPICEVRDRAWGAIKDISSRHPEGSVVVVSHYVAIMSIVCSVLDLPLAHIVHLKLDPGTITVFSIGEDGATRLELFNDGCQHTC
jgi:probable phosphoglycerate mutase